MCKRNSGIFANEFMGISCVNQPLVSMFKIVTEEDTRRTYIIRIKTFFNKQSPNIYNKHYHCFSSTYLAKCKHWNSGKSDENTKLSID